MCAVVRSSGQVEPGQPGFTRRGQGRWREDRAHGMDVVAPFRLDPEHSAFVGMYRAHRPLSVRRQCSVRATRLPHSVSARLRLERQREDAHRAKAATPVTVPMARPLRALSSASSLPGDARKRTFAASRAASSNLTPVSASSRTGVSRYTASSDSLGQSDSVDASRRRRGCIGRVCERATGCARFRGRSSAVRLSVSLRIRQSSTGDSYDKGKAR